MTTPMIVTRQRGSVFGLACGLELAGAVTGAGSFCGGLEGKGEGRRWTAGQETTSSRWHDKHVNCVTK